MGLMSFFDDVVECVKEKIDLVTEWWDGLDESRQKLLIGCAVAGVCFATVASIAYSLGKAKGYSIAIEEEDF